MVRACEAFHLEFGTGKPSQLERIQMECHFEFELRRDEKWEKEKIKRFTHTRM